MKKILLFIAFIFSPFFSHSQAWSNMGNGFDGDVTALCIYNNSLYAAGNFTHDGNGSALLNHIARWTGSMWEAVGTGLDGNVSAMTVFQNNLYVGGDFVNAGGTPASKIAKWNGTSWSAVSTGFNNTVKCLYAWTNALYAGGSFTTDGTGITAMGRTAKLNGSAWEAVGNLTLGIVNTMIEYNNELYIGGSFASPYLNKLSGNTWVAVNAAGSPPDLPVHALAVFKYYGSDALWLGGQFSSRLKTYKTSSGYGTSFNPFGGGNVNALCGTHSNLYAGGNFNVLSAARIAKFNGSTPWDTLGPIPDNEVNAFTVYNGHLIAGGKFTTIGVSAKRIAIRNTLIGVDESDADILSKNFFPNPFTDQAILKIQSKKYFNNPELELLDISGKEISAVATIVSFNKSIREIEFRIERSGLPAGTYFYRLLDEEREVTAGRFVIQ